ncbi:MAG: hypothetical protein K6C13_11380 [Oscillospiraceae bacterium]|nr:hypothetical protein [Oscillospiraceae bacterium]
MACFLVPMAEAIVTTAVNHNLQKKEEKNSGSKAHISFSKKLNVLNNMLWGGSGLLAFEHVWHGEVVPFFPFLTAAETPEGTAEMLHEMSTNGVGMALLVTLVWGIWAAVEHLNRKNIAEAGDNI